jgi:hypothetical protein
MCNVLRGTSCIMSFGSKNRIRCILSLLTVVLCASFLSCDKSLDPRNHPPVITDIVAEPAEIAVADTVTLTVVASDGDGDSLSYRWTVDGGRLVDTTGVTVRWTSPPLSGTYAVTVFASDKTSTCEKTKLFSTEGVLVEGAIGGVWQKDHNPYIVIGDCYVHYLGDLKLEPGVEVRVKGPWKIVVYGGFYSMGTREEPVVFTSDGATGRPGDWGGLEFADPQGPTRPENRWPNELRWTLIEYAVTGIDAASGWTSPLSIRDCLIRRNSDVGVYATGGFRDLSENIVIEDTEISENGKVGVICSSSPWMPMSEAVLKRCIIRDNGYSENSSEEVLGGVYCVYFGGEIDSCAMVGNGALGAGFGVRIRSVRYFRELHDCILEGNAGFDLECRVIKEEWDPKDERFEATCNYWGQAATAEMEAGGNPKNISSIYDKYDDNRLWEVDYASWLTAPPDIPESWPQ